MRCILHRRSENLSHSGKDATLDCHLVGQPASAFLNLSTLLQDQVMVDDVDEAEESEHEIYDDTDSWKKVRPRRHSKQHIELKDLTENDFTSLIEAKNQDKRFYSWLNFQPLFQGIETGDPTEEHERQQQTEIEEDQFLFFNDLFGLNLQEEDSEMAQPEI